MEEETSTAQPVESNINEGTAGETANKLVELETAKSEVDVESKNTTSPLLTINKEQSGNNANEKCLSAEDTQEIDGKMNTLSQKNIHDEPFLQLIDESNQVEITKRLALVEPAPLITSEIPTKSCSSDKNEVCSKSGGLGLLAQYDSDNESQDGSSKTSDTDSVVEVPVTSTQDYRKQAIEIDSEADTDTSTSDSDSEGEYLTALRKEIDKSIQAVDDDDDDMDENENGDNSQRPRRRQPPKVKGEMLLEDLPPIQDLQISVPEEDCVELGRVQSIVDQLVLVSSVPNAMLVDLETVLFLAKGRKVLGKVFDVLGQVADPLYCVRFNSNKQIQEREILIGDIVYCAPKTEHTQFVILSQIMRVQGSDASWENDIEPPPRYLDYSDDEEERAARTQLRNRQRPNENNDVSKRVRTQRDTDVDDDESLASSSSQNVQRQRGRRGTRHSFSGQHSTNGGERYPPRHTANQQFTNHPSYNSSSWHSNYYHNYHPQMVNFNMPSNAPHMGHMPPAFPGYPMPYVGYGAMPPYGMPPHQYHMRPPLLPHTTQTPPPHPYAQSQYGPQPPPPPPS